MRPLWSLISRPGPYVLNSKALLTSADIFVLPDVASWTTASANGSVSPQEIFGDGYFGDMLGNEEFVFIDDAFGSLQSNADGTAVSTTTIGFSVSSDSSESEIVGKALSMRSSKYTVQIPMTDRI